MALIRLAWKLPLAVLLSIATTTDALAQAVPGPLTPISRSKRPHEIYRANCASCHGTQGFGGTSWVDPNATAPWIAGWPSFFIQWRVRTGLPHQMPAFPSQEISDPELKALARYVALLPASYVPEPAYQATVNLLDEDPWFSPMQISVPVGTTIRFVNVGRTYHPMPELDYVVSGGMLGRTSGLIGPGGVHYVTYEHSGTFTYLCGIHPYMRGEVHVGGTFTPPTYAVDAPSPLPATPGVGEVWVCCQFQDWTGRTKDGVVQVIDSSTWAVTHLIPVGNNPHNLWFGVGGAEAVATNWFDATVSRIDGATKAVLGECVAGATPAHVTSDFAGTSWYVSVEGSHYVVQYDQGAGPNAFCNQSGNPPVTAWLSGYGPHGIWYGNGKLVTSNSMDSTFSIVDASTLTELACLPSGMMPMGASANSTGSLGASGNMMSDSVGIYDLTTLTHVRDIPLSGHPIQVPFTPDDQYIFAANTGQVTVIDVAKAADPTNYPNPHAAIVANIPTGKGAHGVAFGAKSGGGMYAYVSHKFENYVSVIDLATMQKVGDVPLVTTTTGKVALAGSTDTGGNGIAVRPNPAPWQ